MQSSQLEQFMTPLLAGDRKTCRAILHHEMGKNSGCVTNLYHDLLWPAMQKVEKLHRSDRINIATEHMATRITRALADQIQLNLKQMPSNGKRILITCADGEPEELGAQMTADLFEARGWEVYFIGGGVPSDEIMSLVGRLRPNILLIFGTQPVGVPQVRTTIDMIRNVGCNPTMNVMISGGVFNRADGLWKEVNADLFAKTAKEAIEIAEAALPRKPEIRIAGAPKKRRRRRRAPVVVAG